MIFYFGIACYKLENWSKSIYVVIAIWNYVLKRNPILDNVIISIDMDSESIFQIDFRFRVKGFKYIGMDKKKKGKNKVSCFLKATS